jgi:hypothetical protein
MEKKIKFSVELMQCEEFCKTLLNDELISALLSQIKNIFTQIKIPKYTKWIEELEENCNHKNEMTRFVEYINDKLDDQKRNSNNNNDNYLDESNGEENINNDAIEHKIEKESIFSLNKNTSNDGNETGKKVKRKKNNKNGNNKNENENDVKENNEKELNFKDIDELLNYINDETDSKKSKKKGKRAKKNKKQNNNNTTEENQQNNIETNENSDDSNFNDEFKKEFENFKKDIEKNSYHLHDIKKITPCLSDHFIENISKF